jgi:hypothetical protein
MICKAGTSTLKVTILRFGSPEEVFLGVVNVDNDITLRAMLSKVPHQFHTTRGPHTIVLQSTEQTHRTYSSTACSRHTVEMSG